MARRRSFHELLADSLVSGWFINRDQDRHWVVYCQATNDVYHVTPPTYSKASRERALLGESGYLVLPYMVARQLVNAFNHGRMSKATPQSND